MEFPEEHLLLIVVDLPEHVYSGLLLVMRAERSAGQLTTFALPE